LPKIAMIIIHPRWYWPTLLAHQGAFIRTRASPPAYVRNRRIFEIPRL